jgi:uncharacterized protein YjbI with pentapeptide repeats
MDININSHIRDVKAFASGRTGSYGTDVLVVDFTSRSLADILSVAYREKGLGTPHFVISEDGGVHQLVDTENRAKFIQTADGHNLICPSFSEESIVRDRADVSFNNYSISIMYCNVSCRLSQEQIDATKGLICYIRDEIWVKFNNLVIARAVVPKYYKAKNIDYVGMGVDEIEALGLLKNILRDSYKDKEIDSSESFKSEEDKAELDKQDLQSQEYVSEVEDTESDVYNSSKEEVYTQGETEELDIPIEVKTAQKDSELLNEQISTEVPKGILQDMDFKGGSMSNVNLINCNILDVKLGGSDVKGGTMVECKIEECSIDSVVISRSKLSSSVIMGSKIINSQIDGSDLQTVEVEGSSIQSSKGVDIKASEVTLNNCQLRDVNLRDSVLIETTLESGVLVDTVSRGPVDMKGVEVLKTEKVAESLEVKAVEGGVAVIEKKESTKKDSPDKTTSRVNKPKPETGVQNKRQEVVLNKPKQRIKEKSTKRVN